MIEIERAVLKKYAGKRQTSAFKVGASLSEIFHENTKLTPLSARAAGTVIQGITRSPTLRRMIEQPFKVYSLMDQEPLAIPEPAGALDETMLARRSVRHYTGEAIGRDELGRMLYYAYGRTEQRYGYRAVPSGGGLFPLEWYVFALRVEGLEPGLYHYNVLQNCLDAVERADLSAGLKETVWFDGIDVDNAACVVVVTAIFKRMTIKYLDRGYRMALMEAGGAAQNFSLVAASLGLGACYVGGFQDDALSALLGIDGLDEAPLLPIVVGRPVRRPAASPTSG